MSLILSVILGMITASMIKDLMSLIIILVSLVFLFLIYRRNITFKRIIILVFLFIIGFSYFCIRTQITVYKYGNVLEKDKTITVSVVSEPEKSETNSVFKGKIKEFGNVKATITLNTMDNISFGDIIKIKGTVSSISNEGGKYLFNNRNYYYSNGIYLKVTSEKYIKTIETKNGFWGYINSLKKKISYNVSLIFSYESSLLIKGILLGDDDRDEDFDNALKRTGLSHIVVVSGMHFSIINMILIFILRRFGIKRKIVSLVSIPISLMLAFFVGFSASVVRALIMLTVLNVADIISKERITDIYLVSATALVMLGLHPFIIYNVGFILSFASVGGIILLSKRICDKIKLPGDYLKESVSVSISANLFTLPVVVYCMKGISLTFLIANIAISFLLPVIMAYGIIVIAISFVSMKAGCFTAFPLDCLLRFASDFIMKLSYIPLGYIETLAVEKYTVVIYYIGVLMLVFSKDKKRLLSLIMILYFILSAFCHLETYISERPELYIFCGKDSGKVLICYRETNIYIDLSTADSIDVNKFMTTQCPDKLSLAVFGTAKNMNNAYEDGIFADKVYYHKNIENNKNLMEYVGMFDEYTSIKDKISIKCGDINLTLKVGKSYNISEAEISYKNRIVTVTNDLYSVKSDNMKYIISNRLKNVFKSDNILNCDKQEIERVKL